MHPLRIILLFSLSLLAAQVRAEAPRYPAMAREVTADIQAKYWMPERKLYRTEPGNNDPEMVWGGGILFAMLVAASRHEPLTYRPLVAEFHEGLNSYWDSKAVIPGYEPCPTRGGGHDKYYDDNAWLVLNLAEAWRLTDDRKFFDRSNETLRFVLSGWDDTLGGGIWWHELHKDNSKNTCINAPAAVGCLTLAKYRADPRQRVELVEKAKQIVEWTRKNLQAENGLYMDNIKADSRDINRATLTYNSALMIRAELMLHEATGDKAHLAEAKRIAASVEKLCHQGTLVYRDPPRWSHLLLEADLELFRKTRDARALERAKANADSFYQRWKDGKDAKLIDRASVARALWLMTDHQTQNGRDFWKRMDLPGC